MQLLTFIKKDEEHKSFLVSMNEERQGAGRAVGVASATDWKGQNDTWKTGDERWSTTRLLSTASASAIQ